MWTVKIITDDTKRKIKKNVQNLSDLFEALNYNFVLKKFIRSTMLENYISLQILINLPVVLLSRRSVGIALC